MPPEGSQRRSPVRRFFGTPKGLLIILLVILVGVAAVIDGARLIAPGLVSAVAAAVIVDLPILRLRSGKWDVPSGAVLTGMLIAMVLSPHEPWYVPASRVGVENFWTALLATVPEVRRPAHGWGWPPLPGTNVLSCSPVTSTTWLRSTLAKICS